MQYVLQICSLSTIAREYIALCSVGSLPFKDLILKAAERDSGSKDQAWKISGSLHDYFEENLNKSQQEAIDVSLCLIFNASYLHDNYPSLLYFSD